MKRASSEKASVEKPTRKHATKHGVKSRKMNLRFQRSYPDVMFEMPMRPWLVEFKKFGKVPTDLQEDKIADLRSLGWDVEVHDNKEEAIAAFNEAFEIRCNEYRKIHGKAWKPYVSKKLGGGERPRVHTARIRREKARALETSQLPEEGNEVHARERSRRAAPRPRAR